MRRLAAVATSARRLPSLVPLSWQQRLCTTINDPQAAGALEDGSQEPLYYNFSTFRDGGSTAGLRSSRGSGAGRGRRRRPFGSEETLVNPSAVNEDITDAYKHLHIFRKDMSESHGGRGHGLSVDLSVKGFTDMFSDYDTRRCKLCNESYTQWHSHTGCVPHGGREAMLLELVRPFMGTPEEIVQMFWDRLHHSRKFERIRSLSHANSHIRKRRLQYVLQFLHDRRILVDVFNVNKEGGAGRSWEFERLEWLGDNVVKYILGNRMGCLFPVSEGGIKGRLSLFQFVIDGNDGLARGYDYLELQQFTQSDRIVSKFKSDCVETLFGELQVYLWSSEEDVGTEVYALPFSPEMFTIRALARHAIEELGHVLVMYHIESVLGSLQRVAREKQLQFVRADPALRGNADLQSEVASHMYARNQQRAGSLLPGQLHQHPGQLSKKKVPVPSLGGSHNGVSADAALFAMASSYDSFSKVVPLGGLLPRPFADTELSPSPNYLPQLQRVPLARPGGAADGGAGLLADEFERLSAANEPACGGSHATGLKGPLSRRPAKLSVADLKDHRLVEELL